MSYTVRHRPRGAEHTPYAQGLPLYDRRGLPTDRGGEKACST